MRTSYEKIVQHVGTNFRQHISTDAEGDSHFQFERCGLQFSQVADKFESPFEKLFNQSDKTINYEGFSLRHVILLDSQSTMDL